jgi:hypothetical protein
VAEAVAEAVDTVDTVVAEVVDTVVAEVVAEVVDTVVAHLHLLLLLLLLLLQAEVVGKINNFKIKINSNNRKR